jgi:hypothetical protein
MTIRFFSAFLFFAGCAEQTKDVIEPTTKNTSRDALVFAATEDSFVFDEQIRSRLEDQRRKVLGKLYLENLVTRRVSVSMGEVEDYYIKTKKQHVRKARELLLLRFGFTSLDTARLVREKLDRAATRIDDKVFGEIIAEFQPTRELVDETIVKKTIRTQLLRRRGSPVTIGPLSVGRGYAVFHLLKVYEKGTTKEQIHVQEKLRNQLLAMKSHAVRVSLVDSLKAKYVGYKKK